jgi:GT2 family glycosyltransferase
MASSTNRGFTGGNNAILRPAMQSSKLPQYCLLLNPDTIVRPNAFRALLEFMDEHPKVGIAGCRLEEPDGTPQRSAFRFQSPASEFESGLKLGVVTRLLRRRIVAPPARNEIFETDWVSGACMIVRNEVFHDTGLLDEGFNTYFDDCDFCYNSRKAGWSTWYVPTARVVHLVGQSTGVENRNRRRLPPYYFEARRRYFLKNHGPLYSAMADLGQIAGSALWRLRVMLTGKEDFSPSNFLHDLISHSVFLKGFRVNGVQNPALVENSTSTVERCRPDPTY